MVSKKGHEYVDKLLGLDPDVDSAIDFPVMWAGYNHRKHFHTDEEAFAIGAGIAYAKGEDPVRGGLGGMVHVATDKSASADKTVKAYIELASRMKYIDQRKRGFKNRSRAKVIGMR